jgi:hypothetical protein
MFRYKSKKKHYGTGTYQPLDPIPVPGDNFLPKKHITYIYKVRVGTLFRPHTGKKYL